jgi:hypothetical protein
LHALVCEINFTTSYSLWLIPLCILLGIASAYFMYHKDQRFEDVVQWKIKIMMTLRAATIALLLFFLLEPVINTLRRTVEKPIILLVKDDSASLTFNNDSASLAEIDRNINVLGHALEQDYEVRHYTFGEELSSGRSTKHDAPYTDISNMLSGIEERYLNRNIGALILVSDGIYNKGSNPIYGNQRLDFPVYTIGVGDTAKHQDLILKDAKNNRIAHLGNSFPVKVDIEAIGFKDRRVEVSIKQQGKTLAVKKTTATSSDFQTTLEFILEAKTVGIQRYTIEVDALDEEKNKSNNIRDVYIEVLEGRQSILLLSYAPHPDIGALFSTLSSIDNYKVENVPIQRFSGKVDNYDLIVLHQLPANAQHQALLNQIMNSKTACLFILGSQSSIPLFNALETGLQLKAPKNNQVNEAQATFQETFSLFSLSETSRNTLAELPPLQSPFGEYAGPLTSDILFTQKIGRVESQQPLIAFNKRENKKIGYLCGTGIWRWKMAEYQKNEHHQSVDELVEKMAQYLAVKEDKSRFRVKSKHHYFENESIVFEAEFYNEAYELTNLPEVALQVTDSNNKEFSFVFNKTSNAYVLNAGTLPVGEYHYKATVQSGSLPLVKSGVFVVSPIIMESLNAIANYENLDLLSKKFGGQLFSINEVAQLPGFIKAQAHIKPISHLKEEPVDFIHLKWLFFILLLLVSTEWFMRKRNGAY